jgi:hypothetical protein
VIEPPSHKLYYIGLTAKFHVKADTFLTCGGLYLALSPSYIHPDEHFQGPEVVAGMRLRIELFI